VFAESLVDVVYFFDVLIVFVPQVPDVTVHAFQVFGGLPVTLVGQGLLGGRVDPQTGDDFGEFLDAFDEFLALLSKVFGKGIVFFVLKVIALVLVSQVASQEKAYDGYEKGWDYPVWQCHAKKVFLPVLFRR
jgi:hypothetical protein